MIAETGSVALGPLNDVDVYFLGVKDIETITLEINTSAVISIIVII